jgi:hypothetical protein
MEKWLTHVFTVISNDVAEIISVDFWPFFNHQTLL